MELRTGEVQLDASLGLPVMTLHHTSLTSSNYVSKRLFDVAFSLFIIIVGLIPFLIIAMEALLELKTAAASVLIVSLMVCATPFLTSAVSAGMYMSGRYESPSSPSDKRLMAHWLGDNTSPDDYVYFWGAESGINFTSLRRSPSKIHYIYPLITPGCDNSEDAARLIGDLKRNPPKFIIDCSIVNPAVPPLGFNFAGQPQAGADGYLWHAAYAQKINFKEYPRKRAD